MYAASFLLEKQSKLFRWNSKHPRVKEKETSIFPSLQLSTLHYKAIKSVEPEIARSRLAKFKKIYRATA